MIYSKALHVKPSGWRRPLELRLRNVANLNQGLRPSGKDRYQNVVDGIMPCMT